MKICAADLNTFVTIEIPTGSDDGAGGVKTEWSVVYEAWAKVVPLSARRSVFADQASKDASHRFYIRYDAGVRLDGEIRLRLIDGQNVTRYYRIEGIIDYEFKHEFWELTALEGVAT